MVITVCERKRRAIARALRRCLLFSDCRSDVIDRLAAVTVTKTLAPGDYVFHEGSPVHGVYIVHIGAVKMHRVNPLGREQVIHVFRPGESFGEESLVSESGHPACASTTEPSEVFLVSKREFLDLLRRQPDLALGVLRSMNRQVHILVGLLDDLTLKDVKTRLANWLLAQCPDPVSAEPVCIRLPSTKRVLAAELGTVSETLSRTVAKLRDQKLLRVRGDTVTLLSPLRLSRLFRPAPVPGVVVGAASLWSGWMPLPPRGRAAVSPTAGISLIGELT